MEPFTFKMLNSRSQFTGSNNRLKKVFTDFSKVWQDTGEFWLDDRRSQFERKHLTTIGPSLQRLSSLLSQLTDTVADAEKDLSDGE